MFFKALRAGYISTLAIFLAFNGYGVSMAEAKTNQQSAPAFFAKGGTIEIKVQDEKDLSNTYYIDKSGMVDLPLIGHVTVAGKDPSQIKDDITAKLKDGYLKNPIVTVKAPTLVHTASIKPQPKASNDKAVYIVGEINKPGYYTLPEDAQHLLNLIAIAGGYTDKADTSEFEIVRKVDGTHYRKTAKVGALEYIDGDIIIIKERF